MIIVTLIAWILAFAITITIHEVAHAWMADKLGDPTARLEGRLTLNPLAHYDPVGTTLLLALVMMRAMGIPVIPFGWAKPVPIDPYNLKNHRKDAALISLAGPAANIIFAVALSVILRFNPSDLTFNVIFPIILMNVSLAIFNLIPIHPLDGGKVVGGLLDEKDARTYDMFLDRFGTFLLFMFIFPIFNGQSIVGRVIDPIIGIIVNLLVPGASMI